jgi:hypothetical protein
MIGARTDAVIAAQGISVADDKQLGVNRDWKSEFHFQKCPAGKKPTKNFPAGAVLSNHPRTNCCGCDALVARNERPARFFNFD